MLQKDARSAIGGGDMRLELSLLFVLLMAAGLVKATDVQVVEETAAPTADAVTEKIGMDVPVYLDSVRETVALAERGELGRIKRDDLGALRRNAKRIDDLLRGRSDARELSLHQRTELYSAQSEFESIAQHQREHGQICRQVSRPGTRLTSTECMSVSGYERTRRAARETAEQMIHHPTCINESC